MRGQKRAELIESLIFYAGEDYDEETQAPLIESMVDDAIEEVRNARYPFGFKNKAERIKQEDYVLNRYLSNIRRISQYHYDKIGKEGVTTFYESGQTTSWEAGGTPSSFFVGIIPVSSYV